MIILELTKEQAQQLLDLLDLATKSGGLQVASVALPVAAKLLEAAKQAETQAKEPEAV